MELHNKKIILGSKSPRRKQILEDAGFDVEVVSFDVQEDYPESLKEHEIAEFLAIKKAQQFRFRLTETVQKSTAMSTSSQKRQLGYYLRFHCGIRWICLRKTNII